MLRRDDNLKTSMTRTALLLCLAIAGCVSVPLSTMVRMSTFGVGDFVQLNPDAVRVRITLPLGYALNAARSSLGVRIESPAGVHDGTFKLDQDSVAQVQVSAGMFSATTAGTAYTLKLSAPSKKAFLELQTFVGKGNPGQITISVVPILFSFPDDVASVKVWIDLLLSEAQGFFTLLDAAEVPLDAIREASAGR
ncbi:MAG: hypothetical protein WC809_05915 [Sinimarinibacterium sp.]|jgi:hypothetical protein